MQGKIVGVHRAPRPGGSAVQILTLVALAVVAGASIMLQVRGWSAIQSQAGGACGRVYGPCPRGASAPVPIGSFLGVFVSGPLIIRYLRARPGVYAIVVTVGCLGGLLAGQAIFSWLQGTAG